MTHARLAAYTPVLAWMVIFSATPAAMLLMPDIPAALAAFVACKLAGIGLLFLPLPRRLRRIDQPV